MSKYYIFILLVISTLCFSQSNEPVQKNDINKLKKDPDLWYVDQKFSPDSAEIVYDSLVKGQIFKPKKKEAIIRDTIPEQLNIPEWLFAALKHYQVSFLFYSLVLQMKKVLK